MRKLVALAATSVSALALVAGSSAAAKPNPMNGLRLTPHPMNGLSRSHVARTRALHIISNPHNF